ncbi:MAG: metal dependent phosphohydrolase [Bacillales bacterium]|jgi:3'-5' exoribonuclease|nr:metal dependent phosphohydrolase [Bacillales bacterium]
MNDAGGVFLKKLLEYTPGEQIDLFLFIKKSTKAIATTGKPYLTFILQDQSGELEARLWDVSPEGETSFVAEAIVKVFGEIQDYKGKKQIRIKGIRLKESHEVIDIGDLLPRAPVEKLALSEALNRAIFEINNTEIQTITSHLLRKYKSDFLEYPAATKNHHEFVSGLAYHVTSMLELAKAISTIYPSLNKDLLYAGVILHDLGKVIELSGPVATVYTVEGNLLGHISIMANEISKAGEELGIDSEAVMLLQHLVLSHHGKAEWGSPKPPMIREAEILHYIDNIDARMNMMDRALQHVEPGEFSERIFSMDNRQFYKPKNGI